MRDDRICLVEILDAIRKIKRYAGNGYSAFLTNQMAQDAIVRNIEIMGEASRALTPTFKDAHPEIPWRKIIGMRNVLIHEYFRTDLEAVWAVVEKDLDSLEAALGQLLQQSGNG